VVVVRAHGCPGAEASAIGVDEITFARANAAHSTVFATGIVDLDRARLIDIVPGRSRKVLPDWLSDQPGEWTANIGVAALDPFCGYSNALSHGFRNFHNYRLRLLLHCGITGHHSTPTPLRARLPRLAGMAG
jgi:transposase